MPHTVSPESLPLAAEDRFLVIGIRKAKDICPSANHAAALGVALSRAAASGSQFTPVLDFRGLECVYNDVVDFVNLLREDGPDDAGKFRIIASQQVADEIAASEISHIDLLVARDGPLPRRLFNLTSFSEYTDKAGELHDAMDSWAESVWTKAYQEETARATRLGDNGELPQNFECRPFSEFAKCYTPASLVKLVQGTLGVKQRYLTPAVKDLLPEIYEHVTGSVYEAGRPAVATHLTELRDVLRTAVLLGTIREMHHHSLLVEMALCPNGDAIRCIPYHAGGAHQIDARRDSNVLVARPGVVADRVAATLRYELVAFEQLLSDPCTQERHIQKFLESHPAFLRGLGYKNMYPQVVLVRDDATSLRPDFILEPFDGAWCDILDVKLPKERVVVGTRDRATLAAGIHEVAAQLREYAAYFEQDRYRKLVKDRYGLSVYRPRLIALVGNHVPPHDDAQVRRALTQYEEMRVLTFDDLVQHASNRVLI